MASWFYSMSKKQQAAYIKAHPNSKFAKKKNGGKRLSGAEKIRQAAKQMNDSLKREAGARDIKNRMDRQNALFSRIIRETDAYSKLR